MGNPAKELRIPGGVIQSIIIAAYILSSANSIRRGGLQREDYILGV